MQNKLKGFSTNQAAVEIIEKKLLPRQEELRIKHTKLSNGCNVIDMGIEMSGGWLAGKYFTEISLCGLCDVKLSNKKVGDFYMPTIAVFVDYPNIIELSCHCAFWHVEYDGIAKNLSGPVRSKNIDDYSGSVPYRDTSEKAVAALQIDFMPSDNWIKNLADIAGVKSENFYLMVARTGTLVGSLQVCARNVEQTLPTLADKGFDLQKIQYAFASTPVISVVNDETEAYGRVNDCLIYGQETNLYVNCEDSEITSILPSLTMNQERNAEVFGMPFKDIFAKCNNDWCQVPRHWDAPSKVNFYNLKTNNSFVSGAHCYEVLTAGFLGKEPRRV